MEAVVNGDNVAIDQNENVTSLLQKMGLTEQKGFAVAINESVVPSSLWTKTEIKNQDKILIIKATQGG